MDRRSFVKSGLATGAVGIVGGAAIGRALAAAPVRRPSPTTASRSLTTEMSGWTSRSRGQMALRLSTLSRSPSSRVSRLWLSLRDLGPARPAPAPRGFAAPVASAQATSHSLFWGSVVARCRTQCRRACPRRACAHRAGQTCQYVEVHSVGRTSQKNFRV